jgi:hypothetical protein
MDWSIIFLATLVTMEISLAPLLPKMILRLFHSAASECHVLDISDFEQFAEP